MACRRDVSARAAARNTHALLDGRRVAAACVLPDFLEAVYIETSVRAEEMAEGR